MRLNRLTIAAASWLAVCAIVPIASAQTLNNSTVQSLKAPTAPLAPKAAPKAPQLEKLAEKEAMKDVWEKLSPEQKSAALEQAKKDLEAQPTKAPRLTGNKEEDAIRGALKRIKQLPASEREEARRQLRSCIDKIVPPPGTPQSQQLPKPLAPTAKPEAAPIIEAPAASSAKQEDEVSPRCRSRKAIVGCR